MKYRTTHTTVYHYSQQVGLCQNEARLQPRNFWRQECLSSYFVITPTAADFMERYDYFGNRVAYFAVQQPHQQLTVSVISEVSVFPKVAPQPNHNTLAWESVRNLLQHTGALQAQFATPNAIQIQLSAAEMLDVRQYIFDSPMVATGPELAHYAQASFLPNRPLLEVVKDLMQRIFHDFTYDPSFTTIATPLSAVLAHRRGVCQDFAHLAIACLRSYGIPARYVSGYIETLPEPGHARLIGADASHAWFAVYIPGSGWVDFDPTNNQLPWDQHITLAWGRDFSDVTPLKGIAFGGGQHTLSVSVDVLRLP